MAPGCTVHTSGEVVIFYSALCNWYVLLGRQAYRGLERPVLQTRNSFASAHISLEFLPRSRPAFSGLFEAPHLVYW